jgi:hypothetical protein
MRASVGEANVAIPSRSPKEGRQTIAGQVAEISVYVEFSETYGRGENTEAEVQTLEMLDRRYRENLQSDVAKGIRRIVGRDFDVDPLIIRPGSIEVLVIITTISAVLANYNEFMERLFKAAEHTRRVVRNAIAAVGAAQEGQYSVLSSVTTGSALESISEGLAAQSQPQSTGIASTLLPAPAASGSVDSSTRIFLWAILAYSTLITIALLICIVVLIQRS